MCVCVHGSARAALEASRASRGTLTEMSETATLKLEGHTMLVEH